MSKPPQQLTGPDNARSFEGPHVPVLLDDVLRLLHPAANESYLDLTAGYGGHASAVIQKIGDASRATLVDRDSTALQYLAPLGNDGAELMHSDFASAAEELAAARREFDMILIDLGVSSLQLDEAERGFSFQRDGPLDMRMDTNQPLTAEQVVNSYPTRALEEMLVLYGEERPASARRIADAIVNARPIKTTGQLAQVVLSQHKGRWQRIHPATRTFQALRIEVNQELQQLKRLLAVVVRLLAPGGRVAIISFHSLEDRMVKQTFAEASSAGYESSLQLLTKKPISGETESVHNPRARSAKLRAAVKIKTKGLV